MPELPEVETVRRAMERHLIGHRITDVWTSGKRLREPQPRALLRSLVGQRFEEARRRAKYLLLGMDSGRVLLVHLGMTGERHRNGIPQPANSRISQPSARVIARTPLYFSSPFLPPRASGNSQMAKIMKAPSAIATHLATS